MQGRFLLRKSDAGFDLAFVVWLFDELVPIFAVPREIEILVFGAVLFLLGGFLRKSRFEATVKFVSDLFEELTRSIASRHYQSEIIVFRLLEPEGNSLLAGHRD